MTYATGRRYLDADSHLMELPGFLDDHVVPAMRGAVPAIAFGGGGRMIDELAAIEARGGLSEETVGELTALGDALITGPKGYEALGACSASCSAGQR